MRKEPLLFIVSNGFRVGFQGLKPVPSAPCARWGPSVRIRQNAAKEMLRSFEDAAARRQWEAVGGGWGGHQRQHEYRFLKIERAEHT